MFNNNFGATKVVENEIKEEKVETVTKEETVTGTEAKVEKLKAKIKEAAKDLEDYEASAKVKVKAKKTKIKELQKDLETATATLKLELLEKAKEDPSLISKILDL